MALYLVQHGKSLSADVDPDRGLSEEGISEVKRVAEMARNHGIRVSCIKHSGKKRASQTADIFASALNPDHGTQEMRGLNPLDDVSSISVDLDARENLMLVGHLPFMERLVSYVITGSVDKRILKFQNGGIVCLDKDPDTSTWIVKWTLVPNIN